MKPIITELYLLKYISIFYYELFAACFWKAAEVHFYLLKQELVYYYVVDGVVTVPDCLNTVLDGTKNYLNVHVM